VAGRIKAKKAGEPIRLAFVCQNFPLQGAAPARRAGGAHRLVALIRGSGLRYATYMRTGQGRRDLGQQGEREAEKFLSAQRYVIVAKNYRSPFGEVDLIALDRHTVVFVEVRSHRSAEFGDPLESVNGRKQRQVAKTALHYLLRHHLQDREARFDVIGIRWEAEKAQITHVKGAFDLPRSL
jgi:putative endonuclease